MMKDPNKEGSVVVVVVDVDVACVMVATKFLGVCGMFMGLRVFCCCLGG
jgi:hypothetical protein